MATPPPFTVAAFLIAFFFISSIAAAQFPQNSSGNHCLLLFTPPQQSLCANLIRPNGYPCSEHKIQTRDGYFLGLQRVSSPIADLGAPPGPPVLLQHGLFMAGDAWFLNSPKQSLGFVLADAGFDVWVGNVRGTRWESGAHIFISSGQDGCSSQSLACKYYEEIWIVPLITSDYWDWSWQELALYDLSEMINHIYSITNSKVFIVGHSQGTIMSLAALTQPDVAEMVEAAALLCPISYLDNISTQLVIRMVDVHLDKMILAMGIHQLNFRSDWGINLLNSVCEGHVDCNDLLSAITGKNCCFNNSRVDFYLDYEPHPSSAKNFHHLIQMIRKGTFSKYDCGIFKNMIEYGLLKPPAFDLSLIPKSLPLLMAYGGNDALADVEDFQHTLKELQSTPQLFYLENYGHVDFIVSTTAKEDFHDQLIEFFRRGADEGEEDEKISHFSLQDGFVHTPLANLGGWL